MNNKPALFITTDSARGVALLRGVEAEPVTRALASGVRRWSLLGRGWVIPLGFVSDVECFVQYYRIFAVRNERRPKR